jgi:hypothetical protein
MNHHQLLALACTESSSDDSASAATDGDPSSPSSTGRRPLERASDDCSIASCTFVPAATAFLALAFAFAARALLRVQYRAVHRWGARQPTGQDSDTYYHTVTYCSSTWAQVADLI